MNNDTVRRVLIFMNQVNEGVFGDSESNQKEIIEFLSSVPDFGDFVEKEKIVACNISAVFTAHETGFSSDVEANGCKFGILYAIMGIVIDVARHHKISPLALCMGLMSILLNDEKMTKDLKDNKEDSLFEILKKMNKEFMN
jgi:hypothetical protein